MPTVAGVLFSYCILRVGWVRRMYPEMYLCHISRYMDMPIYNVIC